MTVRALIAGVATYRSEQISDIPAVSTDLKRVRTLFETCEIDVLEELPDAGRTRLLTTLRRACQRIGPADDLILYFSGHGQACRGRDYLVPADAIIDDFDIIEEVLVPVDLGGALQESSAASITFVIDACREGIKLETKNLDFRTWRYQEIEGATSCVSLVYSCGFGKYSSVISDDYGSLFTASLCEAVGDRAYGEGTIDNVATAAQKYMHTNADLYDKRRQEIVLRTTRGQGTAALRRIFPDGKLILDDASGATSGWHPGCDFLWPRYSLVYDAWAAGHRGQGVTVVLFADMIYDAHIELRRCAIRKFTVTDQPTVDHRALSGFTEDDLYSYAEAWQRIKTPGGGRDTSVFSTAIAGALCGVNVGVCPDAGLINFCVLKEGEDTVSQVELANALDETCKFARSERTIVVLPLGASRPSAILKDRLEGFTELDTALFVASAGHSPEDGVLFPARFPEALSVGAVDRNLAIAPFCDYRRHGHAEPDIYGIGAGLFPSAATPFEYTPSRNVAIASAYVAGVAALVWSAHPAMTGEKVRAHLMCTAAKVRDSTAEAGLAVAEWRLQA